MSEPMTERQRIDKRDELAYLVQQAVKGAHMRYDDDDWTRIADALIAEDWVRFPNADAPADLLKTAPRWVAVRDTTLAKVDAIVALAGREGFQVDDLLDELDEARRDRDKALGTDMDGPAEGAA